MAHGTPRAKVTKSFQDRVNDLEKKAREQSQQFRSGGGARPWHTPDAMSDTSLLDVPNLHEPAWNRDEANIIYSQEVLSGNKNTVGTSGDLASLKKQIDFMAVEERAWRLRHATPARCATLAHGRLAGHGAENAGIFTMVKNVVDNHILSGNDPTGRDASNGNTVT
jgi:hypothetical protein